MPNYQNAGHGPRVWPKHTPGPWEARTLMVVSPQGETIAHLGISNNFSPPRPDECVANATLMAAAPELLALAKLYAKECAECGGTGLRTVSYGGDGYGNRCAARADADDQPCPDCADIRKAIDKAEGRS